jgi:hypothetical protein
MTVESAKALPPFRKLSEGLSRVCCNRQSTLLHVESTISTSSNQSGCIGLVCRQWCSWSCWQLSFRWNHRCGSLGQVCSCQPLEQQREQQHEQQQACWGWSTIHQCFGVHRYGQWKGKIGENICYALESPLHVVQQWVIDDGNGNRTHRKYVSMFSVQLDTNSL